MFLSSKYKLPNYFHGGKQELERRAGTVNVSAPHNKSTPIRICGSTNPNRKIDFRVKNKIIKELMGKKKILLNFGVLIIFN